MTRIDFSLDKPGRVELAVYDLAGRLVQKLVSAVMTAGDHFVTWNGTDHRGAAAAAGIYQYVLKMPQGSVSRSMTLLK